MLVNYYAFTFAMDVVDVGHNTIGDKVDVESGFAG